jgi:hypothetical protein
MAEQTWEADPHGRYRYRLKRDGEWTNLVSNGGEHSTDPLGTGPGPVTPAVSASPPTALFTATAAAATPFPAPSPGFTAPAGSANPLGASNPYSTAPQLSGVTSGPGRKRQPLTMAIALMLTSPFAVLFTLLGIGFALVKVDENTDSGSVADAVEVLRKAAVVFAVLGLVMVIGVLGTAVGKGWARILLTVMLGLFLALGLIGAFAAEVDPGTSRWPLFVAPALLVITIVLLWLGPSNRYMKDEG